MKIGRRNFMTVCLGTLAATLIPFKATFSEEDPVSVKPEEKHPKDVFACEDYFFKPRVYIRQRGDELDMDLTDIPGCHKCKWETKCDCTGRKYTNSDGLFIPEIFDRRVARNFLKNFNGNS